MEDDKLSRLAGNDSSIHLPTPSQGRTEAPVGRHARCSKCGGTYAFDAERSYNICDACCEKFKIMGEDERNRVLVNLHKSDELRKLKIPPQFHAAKSVDLTEAAQEKVADWYANDTGLLTLVGEPGTGKTRAAFAIAKRATFDMADAYIQQWEQTGKFSVIDWGQEKFRAFHFYKVPELVLDLQTRAGVDLEALDNQLKRIKATEKLVILDDLGAEKTTDFVVQCLYTIIDTRNDWGLKTIITTNLLPDDLAERFDGRIASRIAGGDLVLLKGPDMRLEKKKEERNGSDKGE